MIAPIAADAVRFSHFSDIHLMAQPLRFRWKHMFSKRATGWLNLKFGRGQRFRQADPIVRSMVADMRGRGCQHAIFTGDAATLGLDVEFGAAARCLGLDQPDALPGIAVPGNHDYYTPDSVRAGHFERYFRDWQVGERIDGETYPFAQRVGHCWLIGVNTARPNTLVWDARGQMGAAQAQRLRRLLAQLSTGPRILVTHYPLMLDNGEPEHRWRRLRDDADLLRLAIDGGVSLWLHGHRHAAYVLQASEKAPFPIICSGSASQAGRWSWNEYVIQDNRLDLHRRTWQPARGRFVDAASICLELRA